MRIRQYRRVLQVVVLIAGALCGQSRKELFQTSTIDALLQGVYDGEMTFAELRKHGDFGIGTFNGVDGEMIAVGGRFFQITSDGKAHPVRDDMRTPFASVTDFVPDITIVAPERLTIEDLQKRVDAALPSVNWYYAVRVTGRFDAVTTRSVPRQQRPYKPLIDVVKVQPVFHLRDVRGTLAGFRCPEFAKGVNVPGYHLHFLNSDETAGGHVLGGILREGKIEIAIKRELRLSLPATDSFKQADLVRDRTRELQVVEK
ncbi:MAG TPA: acetolactate decarboxylase [Bryobacteraceae bacterium]|nr:acetolactate decarboxylase [Bryobacteraceae bacterium]